MPVKLFVYPSKLEASSPQPTVIAGVGTKAAGAVGRGLLKPSVEIKKGYFL